MADPEVRILTGDDDVYMQGGEDGNEVEVAETGAQNEDEGAKDAGAVDGEYGGAPRATFIESVINPLFFKASAATFLYDTHSL